MTRLLLAVAGLAWCVGAEGTIYVAPTRNDLGFTALGIGVEQSLYGRCTAFYSAEAPVFGAGGSGYSVPDLSLGGNDGSQPTVAFQPVVESTNAPGVPRGFWAFDGADDIIEKPYIAALSKTYAILVRFPDSQFPAGWVDADGGFFGPPPPVSPYTFANAGIRPGSDQFIIRGGNTNSFTCQAISPFPTSLYGSWHWVVFRLDQGANKFRIDAATYTAAITPAAPLVNATGTTRLGYCYSGGALAGSAGMDIGAWMEFDESLSDADVAELTRRF